jgi:HEPN domain-containing protein
MNPLTLEWGAKAEGDYMTAQREYRARKAPHYDAVCFHAQQCAEKYVIALLQERGTSVPRIHNLIELIRLTGLVTDQAFFDALNTLDGYATLFRYPGHIAIKQDAKSALSALVITRPIFRKNLGL